jgi:hypothetical protein
MWTRVDSYCFRLEIARRKPHATDMDGLYAWNPPLYLHKILLDFVFSVSRVVISGALLCHFVAFYDSDFDGSRPIALRARNDASGNHPQINLFQIDDVLTLWAHVHAFP